MSLSKFLQIQFIKRISELSAMGLMDLISIHSFQSSITVNLAAGSLTHHGNERQRMSPSIPNITHKLCTWTKVRGGNSHTVEQL